MQSQTERLGRAVEVEPELETVPGVAFKRPMGQNSLAMMLNIQKVRLKMNRSDLLLVHELKP